MNSNNGKGNQHSFYKEANKSILGQQQWTPQKTGKFVMKIIKWIVFGFLIVATLWGCVNEFIIHTSKNLGQGVEFYQNDSDFIYPNMYSAKELNGYTKASAVGEEAIQTVGIKNDATKDSETNSTEAFNFQVINPNFGIEPSKFDENFKDEAADKAKEDLHIDKLMINSADVKSVSFDKEGNVKSYNDNPELYSYNLNYIAESGFGTASLTGLFDYDWTATSGKFSSVMQTVPKAVKDKAEIKTQNISDEEKQYKINSVSSFIFYLFDNEDGSIDNAAAYNDAGIGSWLNLKEDHDTTISIKDVISTKVGITPLNTSSTVDQLLSKNNWTPIKRLDPNKKEDQIKIEVNKLAFNNGTMKADVDALKETLPDGTLGDSLPSYSVDFTDVLGGTLGQDVFGGSQVYIIPIEKGFPIEASAGTKALVDSTLRDPGYRDLDLSKSKKHDQGFDFSTQMYGWMLLDGNSVDSKTRSSDILRTYETKDMDTALKDTVEEHAFYGDQRRLGWGAVGEDGEKIEGVSGDYTVFDEQIKKMMTNPDHHWMKMTNTVTIDGQEISQTYASTFAGITSASDVTKFDKSFAGTIPRLETYHEKDENGKDLGLKLWQRSILSDSALATGQDSWGESRISFVGWSDWGKAWNVNFGPLYGAFVFPLAQISMGLGEVFNYNFSPWGTLFSIFVIVFLTRGLGALLSLKGTKNQLKMQEVQTEVAKIKARYSKYDLKEDKRMKQKQQSEIMALYRKHEVNPMGSLGTIFVTMPIFISLWIIISALPAYKLVIMGNFSWAVSAWYGIFNLGFGMLWLYLLVGISVGLVQGVSSKLPTWLANKRKGIKRVDEATKASMKKQNRTQNIMVGVFIFMGLTVPALFAFYWIASGFFTISLELSRHAWRVHVSKQMKLDPTYTTPMHRGIEKTKELFKK